MHTGFETVSFEIAITLLSLYWVIYCREEDDEMILINSYFNDDVRGIRLVNMLSR